ncbi:MAG: FAD-binding oxidoreductase [Parvibaculum sp.]|nr:FAD-binding oxidoreductase [Parvibaculum sp.]
MTFQVSVRYSDGATHVMPVADGQTILEAADAHGVPIVSECQSGICGTCVGRCTRGEFALDHVAGLSTHEREQGRILTCQTVPRSDCTVEVDYPYAGNAARIVSGAATIAELERLSTNIVRLKLDVSALPEPLSFKPGQFAQLNVPGTETWRSYSFLTAPDGTATAEFLIRLQDGGAMSKFLTTDARVGGLIEVRGSKGAFYLRETRRPILLIAGGTGLSGVLSIAEQVIREGSKRPVHLIYGITYEDDLVLTDRLRKMAEECTAFSWEAIVAKPTVRWAGKVGLVTDLLDLAMLRAETRDIYLCGPVGMVDATRVWLEQNRLHETEVYFEKFASSGRREARVQPPLPSVDLSRMRESGRGVAIVIGGSIAGMATAKVLLEKYDRVIVLEKDQHHRRMEARPGAAQGWHLHHLLIAGQRQLETIFPGIIDDMVAAGAFRVDMGDQYRIMLAGSWKKVVHSDIEIICAGRPLLEWCIRRRLDGENRIDYRYNQEVTDIILDPADRSVRGIASLHDGQREMISAEFVVDASGKNTAVPAMLKRLGLTAPDIEEDCLNCFYSSMQHKVPAGRAWDDKVMVISYAHRPFQQYYAAQYYTDISRSVLSTSLVGYNCYTPPRNAEEFREFARHMPTPVIGDELDDLEPCSDVFNFRYPEMRRYHYARMKNLPSGLVAIGDALCSADPVSGLGMTKALLELNELRSLLRAGEPNNVHLVRRYYRRVEKIADRAWFVIREQNLRYPWIKDVEKKRPFYFRLHNWYVDRIFELLHEDADIYRLYLSVTHFIAPPAVLMRPSVLAKVLKAWIKKKISFEPSLIEKNFKVPASRIVKVPDHQ